jgi:hypothetical protein
VSRSQLNSAGSAKMFTPTPSIVAPRGELKPVPDPDRKNAPNP